MKGNFNNWKDDTALGFGADVIKKENKYSRFTYVAGNLLFSYVLN